MKLRNKIFIYTLLGGIFLWFTDAVLDYFIFYIGTGSFMDLLILDVTPHEIYVRTSFVVIVVVAGLLLTHFTRKKQLALERNKNWLSVTLKSIGDGVITTDLSGKVTFMNNVAEELTGWSLERAKSENVSKIFRTFHAGTANPIDNPVEQVLSEGATVEVPDHVELNSIDGERFFIKVSAAPIVQDKKTIGTVLVFLNDSESYKTRRALEENEQQLAALLSNLPGMAYRCDQQNDGIIEFVSGNSQKLTGYEPDEFIRSKSITHLDLVSDEDLDRVRENILISMEGSHPFEITYRLKTATGEEKWVQDRGEPIQNSNDGGRYIEGFISDITEQRHVYERYRALYNSLKDAILVTNDKREIIDCNEAFISLFGYDYDEVLGEKTRIIYASDEIYQAVGEKVAGITDDKFSVDINCMKKNRQFFHAELTVGRLYDYLGNQMGNVGVIRDLTEKDILEKELIQAQKMEALGQMAGGIAHDFNNVIASVSGAVQLMEIQSEDDSFQKYFDIIKSSIERGKSVTTRMLNFTRTETLEAEPVSLIEFMRELKDIIEHTLPKNIEVRISAYRGHDLVFADSRQLQQVLISMCINAADSMPDGGCIELGIRRAFREEQNRYAKERDKDYLCIIISDTGTGMDKNIQDHIFEPFFTTKERTKGTGLGLSVAYTIINKHAGWIHVDSKKGVGSTFVIGLPATEQGQLREEEDKKYERLPPAGNGELILVVEDEIALQKLIVEILESNGYRVQVANNSLQALDLFSENPERFALVLTDLGLPKMSGEEMVSHLRQINTTIPIIAATGYTKEERLNDILDQGFDDLIHKPFSLQELLHTIHNFLS